MISELVAYLILNPADTLSVPAYRSISPLRDNSPVVFYQRAYGCSASAGGIDSFKGYHMRTKQALTLI